MPTVLCLCRASPSCRGSSTGWQRPTRVPECWWSLPLILSLSCSHSELQQSTQPCRLSRARGGRTQASLTQRGDHGSQRMKPGSGALPGPVCSTVSQAADQPEPRPSKASTTGELNTELSEGLRPLPSTPSPPSPGPATCHPEEKRTEKQKKHLDWKE